MCAIESGYLGPGLDVHDRSARSWSSTSASSGCVWHGTLAERTCPATASGLADLAGGGTVIVVGAIDIVVVTYTSICTYVRPS